MMTTRHTLVALVEDHSGVLNRIASMFRRRLFNIESLTVGHSELPSISRMTIVVSANDRTLQQMVKQLYKIIEVIKVTDLTDEQAVSHELAMVKVATNTETRSEILQIVDIFKARIIDVAMDSLIVEITGTEERVESLIQLLRPFGIKEMARTGAVAMARGARSTSSGDQDQDTLNTNLPVKRAQKRAAMN